MPNFQGFIELTPEEKREYNRFYQLACPGVRRRTLLKRREKDRAACKKWQSANLGYFRQKNKEYRLKNPERYRNYDTKRRAAKTVYARSKRRNDVCFRIAACHRGRINAALQGRNKLASSMELLGCSLENFKIYLESKFEPDMTWDNHGRTGWHIDHIVPCAIFDLSKPEHQKRCFHFSNLQPMRATENHRKHVATDNQMRLI